MERFTIYNFVLMQDKLVDLTAVLPLIQNNQTIALGGMTIYRRPVAFVRALLQQQPRPQNLTLLAFTAGFASDMLVGGGCVSHTRTCYFGLESFGLAPMFTKAVEDGRLTIIEESEASIACGLRAAVGKLGFIPSRAWQGTDLFKVRPDVKTIIDPYSGETLTAFPAIEVDVAIIHVLKADRFGNAILGGNPTIDEMICVCISRQIEDGELVAQGMATPLVAAGYLLAKLTHAPNLTFISAIGQTFCQEFAPLGLATVENLWLNNGLFSINFITGVCDFLPRYRPKEFFRPGQVDPFGNFNNVFMGGSYEKPRLRLPGSAGIPDVTVFEEHVCLYVPRHGRHTFVPQLDFRSGLGHAPERSQGSGPVYLVSDLGQFDFGGENGRLHLTTHHPGITPKRIQAKTGFPLEVAPDLHETEPPTAEEIQLLREKIDPLGIRTLETLRGAHRKAKLRQILAAEKAQPS